MSNSDSETRLLNEWIKYTGETLQALHTFKIRLEGWRANGNRERHPGEFWAEYRKLVEAIGDGWSDEAYCNLDHLHDVITGQGLPNAKSTGGPR